MTEVSGFQGHPQGVQILVMPRTGCGVMDKVLYLEQEGRAPALYRGALKTTEEGCGASPSEPVRVQRPQGGPLCRVGICPLLW